MGSHGKKPLVLYGVPYASHAEAIEALGLADYQELEVHKKRSEMGLHYVEYRKRPPKQQAEKRAKLAAILIKHGFTEWLKKGG